MWQPKIATPDVNVKGQARMKYAPQTPAPQDAPVRKQIKPVICYPIDTLPAHDHAFYGAARAGLEQIDEVRVEPREAATFHVPAGHFFRIVSIEGSQVGDLNLWNANNIEERFYTGKTRALHGTHLSTGDKMWSSFPYMRPMATITHDTLDWYGFDEFGGSVHDVIGTRCDPYTNFVLSGTDYHHCCHSNLIRALAEELGVSHQAAEPHVHDVLNVFMCTGFTLDTHQYFMKASPVRPGDFLEFFAEIDLLGGLSACPGGDCSASHSSEDASCHPLLVQVFKSNMEYGDKWQSPDVNGYDGSHGA